MPLPKNPNSTPRTPAKEPGGGLSEQEKPSMLEVFKEREREAARQKKLEEAAAKQADSKPIALRKEAIQRQPAKEAQNSDEVEEGWKRDPKTGKVFKVIPKAEYDADNYPVLHLKDLDLDNLNGEADKYLAHLRVPPDKEETKRLLAEKAARQKAANAAYRRNNPEEEDE